jgi:hypothetical protein
MKRNSNLTPAQRFTQYLPMAHKFAHRFAARQQLPLRDMIDEAESALSEICTRWDDGTWYRHFNPKRGCNETSWMYRAIYFELLTVVTANKGQYQGLNRNAAPLDAAKASSAKRRWIDELLKTVGDDAKVIATTILFAPEEIADDIALGASGLAAWAEYGVREYLESQGWPKVRVTVAWDELREAVCSF